MARLWVGLLSLAMLAGLVAETRAEVQTITGFDHQLFPSYLIATASIRLDPKQVDKYRLGDPTGLLGIEVVSPGKDTPIKVTVECDEFFETSSFTGKLAEAGQTYRVTPKIKYRYARLAQCEQATPTTVTFTVKVGKAKDEEHAVTCTMRSINDCPFTLRRGEDSMDVSFAFAAYVNEQHPFVDKLLREALDRRIVKSFHGYQGKSAEDVVKQAYAVWDLLVARDMRYSSITSTAVASDSVACQHVRLLDESVNNSQANCVDGSVLWVSMLRKIGIDGFLVLTSNHCYAGFYLDPKRESAVAIETTLLGVEVNGEDQEISELLDGAVSEELRDPLSFASFVAAINHGNKAFVEGINKKADAKEGENVDAEFQILDIAMMRKMGVIPIPFQNKELFVPIHEMQGRNDNPNMNMDADPDAESMDNDDDGDDGK